MKKCYFNIGLLVICLLLACISNIGISYSVESEVKAFVNNDHTLSLLSLPSGNAVEMLKVPSSEFISTIEFSPNQEKFCLVTGSKKSISSDLYLVDTNTKNKSLLLKVDSASHITKPIWSPDSKKFVVLVGNKELETGDFVHYETYTLKHYDVESNQMLDLLVVKEPINSITWSNDSRFMAFNGKEKDNFSLYVFNEEIHKISPPVKDLSSDWVFKNLNFWSIVDNKLFLVNGSTVSSYEVENKQFQQIKDVHKQLIIQQWNGPKNLVALVMKEGEHTFLDFLSLDNGSLKSIEKGYQIDSPRFSPDGQKISYFFKSTDQTYSKFIVYDINQTKKVGEVESGVISIYPWDVDPTYSKWSNNSGSLLFVTSKENQTQFLSKLILSENQVISVSADWDYLYNYEFSPSDDWICLSGSRTEKEFIEFVSNDSSNQRITKPDLKFCEWKYNGLGKINESQSSTSPSKPTIPILIICVIFCIGLFVILIWFFYRRSRR